MSSSLANNVTPKFLFFSQSLKENRGGDQKTVENGLYFHSLFAREDVSALLCPTSWSNARDPKLGFSLAMLNFVDNFVFAG